MELFKFFLQTGYVGKFVLLILLFLSLQSWYLIIINFLRYNKFKNSLETLEELLDQSKKLSFFVKNLKSKDENILLISAKKILTNFGDIYEKYFSSSQNELELKNIFFSAEKELQEIITIEKEKVIFPLNKGLGFLATVGNVAPFIGLFGTVWGIMKAFHDIGLKGSASLATVAPGIAEALINTAMGLFCAIPAVIAYNYFLLKKENFSKSLEIIFKKYYILLKREFPMSLHKQ